MTDTPTRPPADTVAVSPPPTVAAAAVVPVLHPVPDPRAAFAGTAPSGGDPPMIAATRAAVRDVENLLNAAPTGHTREAVLATAVEWGITALHDAIAAAGRRALSDAEAARLSVLLIFEGVRDQAWHGCDGSDAQLWLWADLTRRAAPPLAAAPARLLAATAYLRGDGPLARAAAQRAVQLEPDDRQACGLIAALDAGVPPHQRHLGRI